jgi:hypothetical protein
VFTNGGAGTLSLTNSIVAGNTTGGNPGGDVDLSGPPATGSNNLLGNNPTFSSGSNNTFNVTAVQLNLAPLGDYGGPTRTIALLPGSVAIGGVPANAPNTPATDQRGVARNTALATDVGAFQTAATPLVVNLTGDVGVAAVGGVLTKLTLREAVNLAGITPGNDTVTFDPTVFATAQTITLTQGQINLTNAAGVTGTLTVQGTGANLLSVSGHNASGVFYLGTGTTATLQYLTVTGGNISGVGGGVFNNGGTLSLTNCTVSGNSAGTDGGGVDNEPGGTLNLTNCTLSGNSATHNGGGAWNNGTLNLTNCTLSGNSAGTAGGGVYNVGTLNLTNCTLSGNSATNTGGGVYNYGTATLTNAIVAGNTTGGNPGGDVTIGAGGTVSGSNNLLGNNPTFSSGSNNTPNVTVAQLGLARLDDYGGPTQTMALLPGSVAIGGVPVNAPNTPATDQRGVVRNTTTRTTDVGAFQTTATPFVVTTTADTGVSGKLTLREAVNLAGVTPGNDTVTFDPTVFATAQTITLTQGQINLTNAAGVTGTLTVQGTGAGLLSVSGNNASRVFYLYSGTTAILQNLTVTGGKTPGAALGSYGGGVFNNAGVLSLTNCTVTGNSATAVGGGVFNGSGSVSSLTNCTVTGNSAPYGGGVDNDGTMSMTNCTVSGNSASAAGGGVFNFGGTMATLTLTNCTVSGNSANGGGGVYNGGGGGGGGTATLTLTNSIVAGNTVTNSTTANDISGSSPVAGSNNVIGTGGSGGLTNGTNGNQVGVSVSAVGLAPLANNGGPTQTIALLPGSPALGGVPANAPNTPATDQRGLPRNTALATDVGAFQTQPTPPAPSTPAPVPPAISSSAIISGTFGTFLMLTGPGGTQFLPVPRGTSVISADVNGDGVTDVVLELPNKLIVVLDGQTGRLLAVIGDLFGNGRVDVLLFSPPGTPKTLIVGKTGMEISLGG